MWVPFLRSGIRPWSPRAALRGHAGTRSTSCSTTRSRRRRAGERRPATTSSRCCCAARDEDGNGLTDAELRDELMTAVTAGHETTATGLSWTFDLLLHHPAELSGSRTSLAGDDDELPRRRRQGVAARPARCSGRGPRAGRARRGRRARAAGGHRCGPGDHGRAQVGDTAIPSRASSGPSVSRTASPRPTRGSPSAAARAAASAPRSPSSR